MRNSLPFLFKNLPALKIYPNIRFYDVFKNFSLNIQSGTALGIQETMSTINNHMPQLIAIPHYGQRIMPRFGLAREFYLVTADRHTKQIEAPIHQQWDPAQERSVIRWLKQRGASGVICDGIHPRFQTALKAEGLWILCGVWGEIGEVLERWLNGQLTASNDLSSTGQETCCRPARSQCQDPRCPKPSTRRNPS